MNGRRVIAADHVREILSAWRIWMPGLGGPCGQCGWMGRGAFGNRGRHGATTMRNKTRDRPDMPSGRRGTQVSPASMWPVAGTVPVTVADAPVGACSAERMYEPMCESMCEPMCEDTGIGVAIGIPCIDGALSPCIRNRPASTVNSSTSCCRRAPSAIVPPTVKYQLRV